MKLAMVVPGGVDRSGEDRVIPALLALVRRLAAAHELHVFALAQEPVPGSWPLAGAMVHNIGNARAVGRTVAAIRREHRRAPFALVQAIWSGFSGLAAVSAARLLRVPACVHVAGGELVALPRIGYGGQLRWHWRLLERFTLSSAARVTAASEPIVAMIGRFGRRAQLLPLGVDLQSWPPLPPRPRIAGARARLIHVASLNLVKDQTTLIEAAGLLARRGLDYHLDVIGEDTLGGAVQALTARLGLEPHVTFHGKLRQADVRPIMQRADLNLISSLHEAGPLVVLEAAVAGVPTVGTRVGHIADWDGVAASAVAPGDAAGLAAGIETLLGDDFLRQRLALAAQARAVAESADYTAARFLSLYDEVMH